MIVLGLHKDPWHNTCAALIKDGEVVSIAEERLDRIKDSRAFPQRAVDACMKHFGVKSYSEIDLVVLDYITDPHDWKQDCFKRECRRDVFLREIDDRRIRIINHHLCHAYATFYSSGFDEAAILIVDGRGSDGETQSLYHGPDFECIAKTHQIGIGLLYSTVTKAIGFQVLEEGKTMGLAPYGKDVEGQIFDFWPRFSGVRTDYGRFCGNGDYNIIARHAPIESFHDKARAAWEVQDECERAMLWLADFAKTQTRSKKLCISGGVGLNSVANNRILKSGIFDDIFINPAASDTGIALGAALWGWRELGGDPGEIKISPYIGPSYEPWEPREIPGVHVNKTRGIEGAIDLLRNNKIVARWSGRSEMGPRALGNRSILMSPLKAENKDVLNSRVKHREPFRPFAPVVMQYLAADYFDLDRPSPYMLLVPDVLPNKRSVIPAVTHVDGTARVQTVTHEQNPGLAQLVEGFGAKTGVSVLLNTSFNVAGEPIVETAEDAIRCFMGTEIDALLIEDVLLTMGGV